MFDKEEHVEPQHSYRSPRLANYRHHPDGKFCTYKRLTTKEVFYFGVDKKTVISAQV